MTRAVAARAASSRSSTPLRVVRTRSSGSLVKRSIGRTASLAILLGIALTAIVAAVLLEQVVLAQSAFQLTEIRDRLTEAEELHEELLLESARLDSATRIEKFARNDLGMVEPAPGSVRYIVADVGRSRRKGHHPSNLAYQLTPGAEQAAAVGATP